MPTGMTPDLHGDGPYVQNVYRRADAWLVRQGFGQVAQWDTTFAFGSITEPKHLGSAVMRTDFGHEQIVTVISATIFTGGLYQGGDARKVGQYVRTYIASIYDVTTDRTWEELLHPRTSDLNERNDKRAALYETDVDNDVQRYLQADDRGFFFVELSDVMYFGSPRAGLWAYIPSTFDGWEPRTQQVNSVDATDWRFKGYGESASIVRVSASPGLFPDAFAYLTDTEFPRPRAAAAIFGRLAIADRRTVYFSDIRRPSSIIADNFLTIPSENDIEAVSEINGVLVISTTSETFVYAPPPGGQVVTGGRLTKVSEDVGAVGPTAAINGGGALWWADRNGIFATTTGVDMRRVSEGFEVLFAEYITNPLTQFYAASGFSNLTDTQPRIEHRFDPERLTMTWDHVRAQLIVTMPTQALSLVFKDGAWSVWNYESVIGPGNLAAVETQTNLPGAWLIMGQDDLYMVSVFDTPTLTDDTKISGTGASSGEVFSVPSYAVMRYGHGGGMDRSIESTVEDRRRFAGKWYSFDATMSAQVGRNTVYIGEPIPVPVGYEYPTNTAAATADHFLLPIEVVPVDTTNGPIDIAIIFDFDSTHWSPIMRSTTTPEIDFILPPERLESSPGYAPGAPVGGTAEVQLYNKATGAASVTGNQVRIRWDGGQAGYAGSPYAPQMNLTPDQRNRLIWIPFRYTGAAADDVLQMGILGITADLTYAADPADPVECELIAWQQALHVAERHTADDVAQAVDWLIKTDQVGLKEGQQVKARTAYLKVRGQGEATTQNPGVAVHGLLNALFGSDFKGWASQIVDYGGDLERAAKVPALRSRLKNSAGAMVQLTFNSASTTYGNTAAAATGNVLIADRALDTVAISESVKGEHVAVMIFGHIRNRAEALEVGDFRLSLVPAGGRRRRGR